MGSRCSSCSQGRRAVAGQQIVNGGVSTTIKGFRVHMPADPETGVVVTIPPRGQAPFMTKLEAKQIVRERGGGTIRTETQ